MIGVPAERILYRPSAHDKSLFSKDDSRVIIASSDLSAGDLNGLPIKKATQVAFFDKPTFDNRNNRLILTCHKIGHRFNLGIAHLFCDQTHNHLLAIVNAVAIAKCMQLFLDIFSILSA